MDNSIVITVTYGSLSHGYIAQAVTEVAEKLRENGIYVDILQVYMPGSKTDISVNGVALKIDDLLSLRIEEKTYELIIERLSEAIINIVVQGVAGYLLD